MKKTLLFLILFLIIIVASISYFNRSNDQTSKKISAVVYKSQACGCCGLYINHLKRSDIEVKTTNIEDIASIKREKKIPRELESCHTTIIGDYFVEGHIPSEAISKLINDKPDIAGIALPGMPSGSPGMPGAKTGPFIIYAVNHDGTYTEFMSI
jgi:hypothetical protein